jgi:hypothetical protein
MGRIKVETMNEKRCMDGVCQMLDEVEYALFDVNKTLQSVIWWKLENQSLMNE